MVNVLTKEGVIYDDEVDDPSQMFDLIVDVSGEIHSVRGAFQEWLNLGREELLGQSIAAVLASSSLSSLTEILFVAGSGNYLQPCTLFAGAEGSKMHGFMVTGQRDHKSDYYALTFRLDPDAVPGNHNINSVSGFSHSVGQALESHDGDLDMTFVEVGDVDNLGQALNINAEDVEAFTRKIEDRLKQDSLQEETVGRIDSGKYGLVHEAGQNLEGLQKDIDGLAREIDPEMAALNVSTTTIALDTEALADKDIVNVIQHAVSTFVDNGLDAVIFDSLNACSDSLDAHLEERKGLLQHILNNEHLTVAFSAVADLARWKVDHLLAEFSAELEDDGMGSEEIISLTEDDDKLREKVDLAQVSFLARAGSVAGEAVEVSMHVRSLLNAETLGLLLEIGQTARASKRQLILRITGLNPEAMGRIQALQTLRDAGFRIALQGDEIGAITEDLLRKLPVDYIIMDQTFVSDANSLQQRMSMLKGLCDWCARNGIRLVFDGVFAEEPARILRHLSGALASGSFFGIPRSEPSRVIMPGRPS